MKIVVCIKQVPDTKGGVVFNPDGTLNRGAMLTIMNPDDKAGLEAALRLKDKYGAEVTVLTMGVVYFDWNSYDGDNDGMKGQELIDYAVGQVRQNKHSILLMHDMPSTSFVHDALPTIIETLQADGYRFERLDVNTPPRQFAQ